MMEALRRRVALALAAVLVPCGAAACSAAWVEMTSGGAEVRLVADGACPALRVDGRAHPMRPRATASAAFPNRVCAASLPPHARVAWLLGRRLALPKARPRRLIILGDSGCRLKGALVQHCNDPSGWPFARIARLAAARRPDLVIHVGDYYYRESPCPAGEAACAGSPFGDAWATWKAELFDPAAPLLAAAPWVFVRGNHEDCARGGVGWFRLLDAAPPVKACPAQSETFAVPIGGATLFVVDSADASDATAPPSLTAAFAARLEPVKVVAGRPAWIVTHRPIWNVYRSGDRLAASPVNATERAATSGHDLAGVQMILSGHVHNFTSLNFGPARPSQLIVGSGGDLIDPNDLPPPVSGTIDVDGQAADAFTMGRFGYLVLDRHGRHWAGGFYDLTDTRVATCRLRGRSLLCSAQAG